ncbi:phage tail assembly protein [Teredinibacter purpureus]|uniref:phage tail assembly protein n=1 Tax=Teredinibacter purpureus TaxID=2731756 RepID=UPI0005F858C6|nr:phage tail assembly protein [Teredinibacter purpureus]
MNTTAIDLNFPINIDGRDVNTLEMRRPRVGDRLAVEKMSGDDADKEIRFIANLCEVAPSDIEKLDMADYLKIQDTLASFLS